jgi:hypothetical protein
MASPTLGSTLSVDQAEILRLAFDAFFEPGTAKAA